MSLSPIQEHVHEPDEYYVPPSPPSVFQLDEEENKHNHQRNVNEPSEHKRMDIYFHNLYEYFRYGGMHGIASHLLSKLLSALVTVVLSVLILNVLRLLSIDDEFTGLYVDISALLFHSSNTMLKSPMMLLYMIICLLYLFWYIISLYDKFRHVLATRNIYHHELHITDQQLLFMKWSQVMNQFPDHQHTQISQQLNRIDNFRTALYQLDVLELDKSYRKYGIYMWYGCILHYNLEFLFFQDLFDPLTANLQLEPVLAMQRACACLAVLNIIIMPITFVFTIFHVMLSYIITHYGSRSDGGNSWYQWSLLSQLSLRRFNELPHVYEWRLTHESSAVFALYSFYPQWWVLWVVTKIVTFFTAAVFLFGLGLWLVVKMDPASMSTFWWWMALDGSILTVSRLISQQQLLLNRTSIDKLEPIRILYDQGTIATTHHTPQQHSAYMSKSSHEWVSELYEMKNHYRHIVELFVGELISVVLTPYILYFHIRPRCEKILDFFQSSSVNSSSFGTILDISTIIHNQAKNKKRTEDEMDETTYLMNGGNGSDRHATTQYSIHPRDTLTSKRMSRSQLESLMNDSNEALTMNGFSES